MPFSCRSLAVLNPQIDLAKHRKALLIQTQNRNTEKMEPRWVCSNLYINGVEIEISYIPGTELSLLWFLTKTRQKNFLFFFSNICSGFPTQHVNWKSYKETGLLKKFGRHGNRETVTDKNLSRSVWTSLRNSFVTVKSNIQNPEWVGECRGRQ